MALLTCLVKASLDNSVSADISKNDCGKFVKVKKGDSGSITSPDYDSNYPDKALCIWLLQAPIDWKLEKTIPTMGAERVDGNCTDFLEVIHCHVTI